MYGLALYPTLFTRPIIITVTMGETIRLIKINVQSQYIPGKAHLDMDTTANTKTQRAKTQNKNWALLNEVFPKYFQLATI